MRFFSRPRPRRSIRIDSRPPGAAPEWVRDAWVGLVLPLSPRHRDGPVRGRGAHEVNDRSTRVDYDGYAVDSREALAILATRDARAAGWWRDNTPYNDAGFDLVFATDCCTLL